MRDEGKGEQGSLQLMRRYNCTAYPPLLTGFPQEINRTADLLYTTSDSEGDMQVRQSNGSTISENVTMEPYNF